MNYYDEHPICKVCGLRLEVKPYHVGGSAYYNPFTGERCRMNHYGGYVCSEGCDRRASVEVESSMPGCAGLRMLTDYDKLGEKGK